MTNKDLPANIKALLAKDELEKTIQLLTEHFKDSAQLDQLILQSGRYYSMRKDLQNGIIAYEDHQKLLNQLRANILEFLNNHAIDLIPIKEKPKNLKTDYQLAKARFFVLKVLLELDKPETISTIYKSSKIKQRKWVMQVLQELTEFGYINKQKGGKKVVWILSEKGNTFAKTIL